MRPGPKLAAFALVVGLAFAGGAAVGQAVGPIDTGDPPPVQQGGHGDVHDQP